MMEKNPQQPTVFDTDQQQLGDVYAKALLGLSDEASKVDVLVDELQNVAEVVNQLPDLKAVLESPQIAFDKKSKLLDKAFGKGLDNQVVKFLKVLTRNGRFECLTAAANSAVKLRDDAAGRVKGVLTTASEVESAVVDRIAQRLTKVVGKEVRLTSTIDPEVIGGMVIRIGDTVYDASVVSRLAQVRSQAIQKASDAIRDKLDRFASSS